MYMHIYIFKIAMFKPKDLHQLPKTLCRHHPIFNQNSFSRISFVLQAKKNQCLFLTNLFHKSNLALLPKCRRGKKLACFTC